MKKTNHIVPLLVLFTLLISNCKDNIASTVDPVVVKEEVVVGTRIAIDLDSTRSLIFPETYLLTNYLRTGEDDWGFSVYRNDFKSTFYAGGYGGMLFFDSIFVSLPDSFVQSVSTFPNPTLIVYGNRTKFVFQDSLNGALYYKNEVATLRNTYGIVIVENKNRNGYLWILRVDFHNSILSEIILILKSLKYS